MDGVQYKVYRQKLKIYIRGAWILQEKYDVSIIEPTLERHPSIRNAEFDTRELKEWDSRLVSFILLTINSLRSKKIEIDTRGLPQKVLDLISLTELSSQGIREEKVEQSNFFAKVGSKAEDLWRSFLEYFNFLGLVILSLGKVFKGQAHWRRSDLLNFMQTTGIEALPIVSLISFLVGLILAFVGLVQLSQFGASIFVANLVGLATVREMGAMMTAIIMAGRTGAAFAASIGSMNVSEETDALTVMSISPIEFLVVPRIVALFLMMPLLCLYADIVGILGGVFVAVGFENLSLVEYLNQTRGAIALHDLFSGLIKSIVFGFIVGFIGCYRGLKCERNSAAVGYSTTKAVVLTITALIVADAIFAVLFNALKI